jgi:putative sigma-54 modulation protein
MKVNFQSVNFKADQKLLNYVQQKLDKLDQFYDRVIDADVFLKVKNTNTRENKIVEIKLNVPGTEILVEKEGIAFEEATDQAADVLKRQLSRHKEKVRGV